MSWKIDTKGDTLNDSARKLQSGTHAYKIVGAKNVPDRQDVKGKRMQIHFVFQSLEDPEYVCNHYLSPMAEDTVVSEIAMKSVRTLAFAAGLTGIMTPERLATFVGKCVVIDAKETSGKGDKKDKTYVNINTVEPYEGAEAPEEAGPEPVAVAGTGEDQTIGEAADAGDDDAITALTERAEGLGVDHDSLNSWVEVEAACVTAETPAPAPAKAKIAVKKAAAAPAPAAAAAAAATGKPKLPWMK